MTLLADEFALTPQERARLKNRLFRDVDEQTWREFAGRIQVRVLTAYADGEVSLRDALAVVYASSIACPLKTRVTLLAATVKQALEISPRKRKIGRPSHPIWLQRSAATLVEVLHEKYPNEQVAPNYLNDWTTPILKRAIGQLTALGLWGSLPPVDERKIYEWYVKHRETPPRSTTH